MTSKTIMLRILDGLAAVGIGILILSVAGFPIESISRLIDMPPREFRAFSIFIVFAALWLMHAIATSDSAP
jgi:divalent metal cation (Fe/Co/Zn/Cd) transporter